MDELLSFAEWLQEKEYISNQYDFRRIANEFVVANPKPEYETLFMDEIKKQIKSCKWRVNDFISEHELREPDEAYFDICFSGIILNVVWRSEGHVLLGRYSELGFEEGRYNSSSVGTEVEMKRLVELILHT